MAALVVIIHCAETCRHGSGHAHRLHNFGIAPAGLEQSVTGGGKPDRGFGRRACHRLHRYREDNQNESAERRRDANQRMKEEANSHIKRHPRQIEQGTWASATQKATDLIEIADRLQSVASAPGLERKARHDVISAARQLVIDGTTDPHQNAAADRIQNPLEQKQAGGENGQTDQRGNIVTRQHPVIDLQHEQRPGQHQNIDEAAEQTDA